MSTKSAVADARLVLAIGKEQVLVTRVVDSVMRAARSVDPTVSKVEVSAAAESAAGAVADALAPSLFGDATVIVVDSIDEATDALADVLLAAVVDVPTHVRLVLTHPGGVKGKRLVDAVKRAGALEASCAPLKGRDLDAALTAEFARHRRTVAGGAIDALTQSVGTGLGELLAAVSQLCADTADEPVTAATVQTYYEGVADVKGWEVSDAMWGAKPLEVLEQFRWAMSADSGAAPAMLAALSQGLRTLVRYASAPAGLREGDLAAHVGCPPWALKKLAAQKSRWTPEQLAAAARLLALADRAGKGTQYDPAVPGGVSLDAEQSGYEIEKDLLAVRPPRG